MIHLVQIVWMLTEFTAASWVDIVHFISTLFTFLILFNSFLSDLHEYVFQGVIEKMIL